MSATTSFTMAFKGQRALLVEKLYVSQRLLVELVDKGVLNSQECSDCQAISTEHGKADKLLDQLQRKDDSQFPIFCSALHADEQTHIVRMLLKVFEETFPVKPPPHLQTHHIVSGEQAEQPMEVGKTESDNDSGIGSSKGSLNSAFTCALPDIAEDAILETKLVPENIELIEYSSLSAFQQIAEGGFGTIYRAAHEKFGAVAYKELKAMLIGPNDKSSRELTREVKILNKRHPNIIAVIGYVFERNHYGIVFELAKYRGLDRFIVEHKADVGWPVKLSIAHGVIRGMEFLHGREPPVVHGELNAQNVLIADGFVAKIGDFGLAKWHQFSTTKTASRSQRSSITHIPPESWQNINLRRTAKNDIYGFGIMLWELLAGTHAYGFANPEKVKSSVVMGKRPGLSQVFYNYHDVPEGIRQKIRECIESCWYQNPEKRPSFTDLNTVFNDIEGVVSEKGQTHPVKVPVERKCCSGYASVEMKQSGEQLRVNIKEFSAWLQSQDWAAQSYHDLKDDQVHISVEEHNKQRALQCIRDAEVHEFNNRSIPHHVFQKPVRYRFRFHADTMDVDEAPSVTHVTPSFPKPTSPLLLQPGAKLVSGVVTNRGSKTGLFSGTIADKRTGLSVAHAFGSKSGICIATGEGTKYVGKCLETFHTVKRMVGGGQSVEITADVAVLELDEACCTTKNVVRWTFQDGTVREIKIKLYKGGVLSGDVNIVILDSKGEFRHGCIRRQEVACSELLDGAGLHGVYAITANDGPVSITEDGDSGALVMSVPSQSSEEVCVYGMVIGVFDILEKDDEPPSSSMTVANSLWDVLQAMKLNVSAAASNGVVAHELESVDFA